MADGRGGARPGAGRPPKPVRTITISKEDPLEFLLAVMQDETVDADLRLRAAEKALAYQKGGKIGKKEERQDAAEAAGAGRFAPSKPPLRVVSNG